MTEYALVADIGGTQLRAALVDRQGIVIGRKAVQTDVHEGRDAVLKRLLMALDSVAFMVDHSSLVGIGIAQAGPTDSQTGMLYNPPNLPGWNEFSAKPILEEHFLLKSSHGNDATLAAFAEYAYGAGRGVSNMIYITVSTGIGGGIIINNRLYSGGRGFAGELGHITIDPNGPNCACGSVGCLETLASGTAVARIAKERLTLREASILLDITNGDIDQVDARMVAGAAREGDLLSRAIMQEAGTNLGVGIVSLLNTLDPELIIIGGGMSNSLDLLLPAVSDVIRKRAIVGYTGASPVVKAQLADDTGLLGAAALAFDAYDRIK